MIGDTIKWAGKGQFQFIAFKVGVAGLLAGLGALDPKRNNADDPIVHLAIEDFNKEHDLNGFADVMAAIEAIETWLPTWSALGTYVKKIEAGSVTVALTMPGRNGASVTITLGETMLENATQYVVNKTVLKLSDMARSAYLSLVDVRGGFGVQPSQANEPQNIAAPGSQQIPAIGILKWSENDKIYYKLLCGEWSEHGVRIWKEVLESSGLDYASLPIGKTALRGYCTVKYNDKGQPSKVTSLTLSK